MIFQSRDDSIFVRLHPGDVLPDALIEVSREADIESAIIVSGIGRLRNAQLSDFKGDGVYETREFPDAMELLSLSGNISRQEDGPFVHAHAALGTPDFGVVGGHLTRGVVDVTNEIYIVRIPIRIVRSLEPSSGLRGVSLPDA